MFNTAINVLCILVYAGFGVLYDKLTGREKNQTLTG